MKISSIFLSLILLCLSKLGLSEQVLYKEEKAFQAPVTIPENNKDRGIRLAFKVQGPGYITMHIPGNGQQEKIELRVKATGSRWAEAILEADIFSDNELQANLEIIDAKVKDLQLSVIEAAANRHYGDNVRISYDRNLKLLLVRDGDFGVSGIEYGGLMVSDSKAIGEFTGTFQSTNYEHEAVISNWKPRYEDCHLSADGQKLQMQGVLDLDSSTGSVIHVNVQYEVINSHVIKKSISYHHTEGHTLFTSMDTFLSHSHPDSYWAWNKWDMREDEWREKWKGVGDFDASCDSIPAVGYRSNGVTVGLLPDSGYLNQWSRIYQTWKLGAKAGERDLLPNQNMLDLEFHGAFPSQKKVGFRLGKIYFRKQNMTASYHRLDPQVKAQKTFFIVVDEDLDNVRKLRLALQTGFAEGKGFKGEIPEKILYTTMEMLTGVWDHVTQEPYVHPSPHYDMIFARDAFWSACAMYEPAVSVPVFNMLFRTSSHMTNDCMRPYVWHKGNVGQVDGTIMSIIWAYVNFKRYGYLPPTVVEKVERILDAERRLHANSIPGIYYAHTAGWLDVYSFAEPVNFSNMQGQYLVALKSAKALGARNVSDEEIRAAEEGYRSFYDKNRGYMLLSHDALISRKGAKYRFPFSQAISPSVLTGEFLHIWLFGKKVLEDEAVIATLDKIDEVSAQRWATGFAMPNVITIEGKRYSRESKPYFDEGYWEEGIYHNGGSWMLYEQLAYAVGHFHNWKPAFVGKSARHRIAKRLQVDLSEKDQPVSQEFLPMTERGINTPGSTWDGIADNGGGGPAGAKVFAWNAFTRIVLEMVGLRPVEDPILKLWLPTMVANQ